MPHYDYAATASETLKYLFLILLHLGLCCPELCLHQSLLSTQLLLHCHLHLPLVLQLHLLHTQTMFGKTAYQ